MGPCPNVEPAIIISIIIKLHCITLEYTEWHYRDFKYVLYDLASFRVILE